jgi:ankyrin repeat protein
MKLLRDKGANLDIKNDDGMTVRDVAQMAGSDACMSYLTSLLPKDYSRYEDRRATFNDDWPSNSPVNVDDVARAGFIYILEERLRIK